MLETKERSVAELILGGHFLHNSNVLDANTKITILVISRLDRCDISCCDVDVGIIFPSAYADRALVNIQVRADAMSSAMSVV